MSVKYACVIRNGYLGMKIDEINAFVKENRGEDFLILGGDLDSTLYQSKTTSSSARKYISLFIPRL